MIWLFCSFRKKCVCVSNREERNVRLHWGSQRSQMIRVILLPPCGSGGELPQLTAHGKNPKQKNTIWTQTKQSTSYRSVYIQATVTVKPTLLDSLSNILCLISDEIIHVKLSTIVFNRKFLYSLNQTTRCQTFIDILKKENNQKNDTKWNYMVWTVDLVVSYTIQFFSSPKSANSPK